MMRRARISSSSTSAVLWLMILLVFLPIAVGHLVARQAAEMAPRAGAMQERASPRAG
jgi:hypothetical protein